MVRYVELVQGLKVVDTVVVVTLGVVVSVLCGNVDIDALNVVAVGNDVVIFVVGGIPVVSMTVFTTILVSSIPNNKVCVPLALAFWTTWTKTPRTTEIVIVAWEPPDG